MRKRFFKRAAKTFDIYFFLRPVLSELIFCSQTKFEAIIINELVRLFYAKFFCLTIF